MVLENPTTNHVSYISANIRVWNYGHQGEVDGGNFLLDQFHLFFMFPTLVITMSNKYESLRMSHKHVPAYLPGDRIAMFPISSQIQFFSFLE